MKRTQMTCSDCYGTGRNLFWEIVSKNTAERKEKVCGICGGTGYTEIAIFTVEEAEAILKYCGLNEEIENASK